MIERIARSIERCLPVFLLLAFAVPLRFINLGYSDYIGDEHKSFIQLEKYSGVFNFFSVQRKGPMQFLVSYIPYMFTHNFRNELVQRIPFSFISVSAVFVFYKLIKKLTENEFISTLSTYLLLVNGFTVGFGRISQYQNLNLLFSFLALYFYSDLLKESRNHLKSSLLGTLFWCLSILSHWDAVFILPVVFIIFLRFWQHTKRSSFLPLILKNFFLGCILLLPFLIPYILVQSSHTGNQMYFSRRVELGVFDMQQYKTLIELYNPFLFFPALLIFFPVGLLRLKRNYLFVAWFLFSFLIFVFLVRKPGTHIYNFIIPALVLVSYGIGGIFDLFVYIGNKMKTVNRVAFHLVIAVRYIIWLILIIFCGFLYYQSYVIFIDHSVEYPWAQKTLVNFSLPQRQKNIYTGAEKTIYMPFLNLTTPKYSADQKLPLFGFPHRREWNKINEFLLLENAKNNEDLLYVTNEDKTISEWYMTLEYGTSKAGYYIVGIKNPTNFNDDYKIDGLAKKKKITVFKVGDTNKVFIYKVEKTNER